MAFTIKQNDRRPVFIVMLKDNFGEDTEDVVDLTTATSAAFNMRLVDGAVKVTAGACTMGTLPGPDLTTGEVTYEWAAIDTNTAGTYEAEIEITWNDGKKETFPNDSYWEIEIRDDIA